MDVVVDDSTGSGVVCLDGSLGLFVAHFRKELVHWDCFVGVDGCTGHDGLEYFGDVEDGSIVGWITDFGGAEKMTADLLHALALLRYDASLCTARIMSLLLYVRMASGLVAT